MELNPSIRKARINDAETIADFNIAMAKETEGKALGPVVIRAGVNSLFANPQYGFYVVAEVQNRIAGCLMITTEWSDWRNGLFWWIQSVYIHPDYRRKGIYRAMYSFVKESARQKPNICGLRLYVEKRNVSAQRTYTALGMAECHYKMFEERTE
ncbi:MAG: GNAT family N-acetyltransferase [Candidatus Marinimicrobia bacterium]|nr:GNAT family N-acetyltransferase [Candidatus Neomarinimicrobiota bacterium]